MSGNNLVPLQFGRYRVLSFIDEGGFGSVYHVAHEKTNKEYACKAIKRSRLDDESQLYLLEKETRIHDTLRHPNIVRIEKILYLEDYVCIIMEYCQHGDLIDYMMSVNGEFSCSLRIKIIIQLASAIYYLHTHNVYHLDIKPENILLDKDFNVKLSDFGCCSTSNYHKYSILCGTQEYLCPEALNQQPCYADKVDIWAFGVTVHSILTGKFPWIDPKNKLVIQSDLDFRMLKAGQFRNLIEGCLEIDPAKRFSIINVVENKAIKDYMLMLNPKKSFDNDKHSFRSQKEFNTLKLVYIKKNPQIFMAHKSYLSAIYKFRFDNILVNK